MTPPRASSAVVVSVVEEDVVVVVTHQGYIKRTSIKSRETSGPNTLGLRGDDMPLAVIETSNLKSVVIFTSIGRYFSIPIIKLTEHK